MPGLAERIGAGTRKTMLHSGDHVEANEIVGVFPAHFGDDALVVVDAVQRRDRGVVPTMIKDELAATVFEMAEVGVGRVESGGGFLVGGSFSGVYIGR